MEKLHLMNEQLSLFDFDSEIRFHNDISLIAGFDEAGRGPVAGPLVECGVVLEPNFKNEEINDSKKLSDKKRRELYNIIIKHCIAYDIQVVSVEDIDRLNILEADTLAMENSLENLRLKTNVEFVITDYVKIKTKLANLFIAKGDALSLSVASASILAKVTRDDIMIKLDKQYPQYLFKNNKGYLTPEHNEAIKKYGYVKGLHRLTFDPIKSIIMNEGQIKIF